VEVGRRLLDAAQREGLGRGRAHIWSVRSRVSGRAGRDGRRHDTGPLARGALASVMPATAMVGMPVPASAGAAMMGGLAPGTLVAAPSVGGVRRAGLPEILQLADRPSLDLVEDRLVVHD
jgi:hypothetical protein